jgi:hypothetical protein
VKHGRLADPLPGLAPAKTHVGRVQGQFAGQGQRSTQGQRRKLCVQGWEGRQFGCTARRTCSLRALFSAMTASMAASAPRRSSEDRDCTARTQYMRGQGGGGAFVTNSEAAATVVAIHRRAVGTYRRLQRLHLSLQGVNHHSPFPNLQRQLVTPQLSVCSRLLHLHPQSHCFTLQYFIQLLQSNSGSVLLRSGLLLSTAGNGDKQRHMETRLGSCDGEGTVRGAHWGAMQCARWRP